MQASTSKPGSSDATVFNVSMNIFNGNDNGVDGLHSCRRDSASQHLQTRQLVCDRLQRHYDGSDNGINGLHSCRRDSASQHLQTRQRRRDRLQRQHELGRRRHRRGRHRRHPYGSPLDPCQRPEQLPAVLVLLLLPDRHRGGRL